MLAKSHINLNKRHSLSRLFMECLKPLVTTVRMPATPL